MSSDEGGVTAAVGFRTVPGGVHLSKTMMLEDLSAVMAAVPLLDGAAAQHSVLINNVLGKPTGAARRLALSSLNTLYGIVTPLPLQSAALRLWSRSREGRPLIALLCALAREPLLRLSAAPVFAAPIGTAVRWPDIASTISAAWPNRYSVNTMRSLAQNCASSWTQSGHLKGAIRKRRASGIPSPEAAAFAALLGALSGFGGPALLRSPWMRVLDKSETELLLLLRRAEAVGLARVRAGGDVVQIDVRGPMAEVLEVPEIGDRR